MGSPIYVKQSCNRVGSRFFPVSCHQYLVGSRYKGWLISPYWSAVHAIYMVLPSYQVIQPRFKQEHAAAINGYHVWMNNGDRIYLSVTHL
jgi:hypothetical protein